MKKWQWVACVIISLSFYGISLYFAFNKKMTISMFFNAICSYFGFWIVYGLIMYFMDKE